MTDQNRKVNLLKAKFNNIEKKLNPNTTTKIEAKENELVKPIDSSFIKINAKKIKSHKKVLTNAEKQLDRNAGDLKVLLELKDDNHYKIEKLTQVINETKTDLSHVESSIKELQNDRISDESRLGRLQTKKVELEGEISDKKRQREIITSDYHNLLNNIYLKEGEMSRMEEELTSMLIEIEKVEKEIAKETRNFKSLSQNFEKKDFHYQKAQVKNKNLTSEHKAVVQSIKEFQTRIDLLNQDIFKFKGENDRVSHHIKDLQEQYSRLETKHDQNFNEVERLRDTKSNLTRRRDELLSNIKALKTEHSKNILELEVRHSEKMGLEKETNELLAKKAQLESGLFAQKANQQSLESSIYELNRQKHELNDSIKVNRLHFSRYETDIIKLRKEANSLKEQYALLISENDRVKKEATEAKHRFIDAENSKNNWQEKRELLIQSISDMKAKIVSKNNRIDTFEKEIEELKSDLGVKKTDIRRYKAIYENTSKQVEATRGQHEEVATSYRKVLKERSSWADRLARREEYIHTITDKVSKIKESIYATEQAIDQDRMKLSNIDGKLSTLKNEQDYLNREFSSKKNEKLKVDQKISHLKMRLDEVETRKIEVESEVTNLKNYIDEQLKNIPHLEEQNEMLQAAIEGAKSEHRSLKSTCDDLKKELRIKEEENKSLEADFERIHVVTVNLQKDTKSEKVQLQKRFADLTKEKNQIEERIHAKKSAMLKMTVRRQELEKESAKVETQLKEVSSENIRLDHDAAKLKAYVDKKALEIQSMRSGLKTESKANIEKQVQLNKLMARSQKIEKHVETVSTDNEMSKGIISKLGDDIRDLHDKNAFMTTSLEHEMKRKVELKNRIQSMKRDIDRLKESFISEQNKSVNVKNQRQALEAEYEALQHSKESLLDEIEMKMTTFETEGVRNQELSSNILKAKSEIRELKNTQALKTDLSNIYTNLEELAQAINKRLGSAKNASIMLTIANDLVSVISENEFNNLKWMAKVSTSSELDGMKIRFKNMQTQYTEMRKILRPITKKLSEKFKLYGINIETRTKTSPGEVLETIDFKITLNNPKLKQLELR